MLLDPDPYVFGPHGSGTVVVGRSLAQLPGTLAPRPTRASTQSCPRAQHGERVFINIYAEYCTYWQCCWIRIRKFLDLTDPEPLVVGQSLARLHGTLAPRPARASTQCCPRAQHGERVFIDSYAKYCTYWQCCGSGSGCFWASRIRIR